MLLQFIDVCILCHKVTNLVRKFYIDIINHIRIMCRLVKKHYFRSKHMQLLSQECRSLPSFQWTQSECPAVTLSAVQKSVYNEFFGRQRQLSSQPPWVSLLVVIVQSKFAMGPEALHCIPMSLLLHIQLSSQELRSFGSLI